MTVQGWAPRRRPRRSVRLYRAWTCSGTSPAGRDRRARRRMRSLQHAARARASSSVGRVRPEPLRVSRRCRSSGSFQPQSEKCSIAKSRAARPLQSLRGGGSVWQSSFVGRTRAARGRRRAASGRSRQPSFVVVGASGRSSRPACRRSRPSRRVAADRCRRARCRSRSRKSPRCDVAELAELGDEALPVDPQRRPHVVAARARPTPGRARCGSRPAASGSRARSRCASPRRVTPVSARYRRSKRNSAFCSPMKSSTVRHGLSSASRSPRPSCWRKTVALSVGRRNSTVSISGMSTPSLNRSTVKSTLTSRGRGALSSALGVVGRGPRRHRQRRDAGRR